MKIGNKIVYPMHGAGIILDIQKEDFFGQELTFCTLKICSKDMVLKFPVERAGVLNIRDISNTSQIIKEMKKTMNRDYMDTSNWNKRYQATLDKMKIGTPEEMAEVIVNLKRQDKLKGLSSGERQLFHNAMDILSSEVMLIEDTDYTKAYHLIERTLEEVAICEERPK